MFAYGRKIAVRYPLVGFVNFLFSMLAFWLLSNLFGSLSLMQLVLFASIISIPFSHFTQRKYVWTSESFYRTELIKFFFTSAGAVISNILLIDWFYQFLNMGIIETQVILSLLIIAVTFFIHYLWTFKQ
jgi:putative flippase GtrA